MIVFFFFFFFFFWLECSLLLSQPSYTLCSVFWCHVCKERLCHSCIFPRCGPLQCLMYTRKAVGGYLCIKLRCCYFGTLLEVRRYKSACRSSDITSRINTPPIAIRHSLLYYPSIPSLFHSKVNNTAPPYHEVHPRASFPGRIGQYPGLHQCVSHSSADWISIGDGHGFQRCR
jgi:hypothetical protein